jgi:hypothetical protein
MKPVSKQRIGKYASTTIVIVETVFSVRSVQGGYKEGNWGNQFSWALQGRLRRDGDPVQLRVESPAVKKRVKCEAVKRRLYACCSYSETVIKSVARIRLVKIEDS